jgi:acid stress chaperone HdeB
MKKLALCLALAMAPVAASAQVDIDTTRITCGEFVALSPGEIETTAAWFSGWFNQKLGATTVDIEAFRKNTQNVVAFCKDHPKDQLFGVIQAAVNQAMKKK